MQSQSEKTSVQSASVETITTSTPWPQQVGTVPNVGQEPLVGWPYTLAVREYEAGVDRIVKEVLVCLSEQSLSGHRIAIHEPARLTG
jgi:hypothetical protein